MTAFRPGASPPPVEIAMRTLSALGVAQQPHYLAGRRVPAKLRFLEDRLSVLLHLKPSTA